MVMTRGSKRRLEEEEEEKFIPVPDQPQEPREFKYYSRLTSARYPLHCPKRAHCVRNKSTALLCSLKKKIRDNLGEEGTHMGNPFTAGIHFGMDESGEIQPLSPDNDKLVSVNKVTAKTNGNDEIVEDRPEASIDNLSAADCNLKGQAISINLTEMVVMDQLDDDECSSFNTESSVALVTVNGYRVKPDLAPILRDILSRHGDIAASCSKNSIVFRSMLVENVCIIVKKLQATDFMLLTRMELEGFLGLVRDIESDDVELRWLHQRLDEVLEAKRLLKESPKLKLTKSQSSHAIKTIESEIEVREQEVSKFHERINSLKDQLTVRREEERKLNEALYHTKSLVKRFYHGSMIDGLL